MQNLTLFGTADGNQDGQTTMIYKGGVVLPEITVTPKQGRYIDNTYDQIKIYPNTIKKHQQGGPFQINNSQPQVLQRYISLVNQGIPQQAAFDTSHLSMIVDLENIIHLEKELLTQVDGLRMQLIV